MNDTAQVKHQFWVLVLISILFLLGAPSVWHYTPDGGIYIGTAQSMVEKGQYWFNGYPNLQYYPGFSSLLSFHIMLFGVNFHILHLFCAAIVVTTLWLARVYFLPSRYGLPGIVVPILMACTGVLQSQVFYILSDGTFLGVSLGALLLWRIYVEKSYQWALIACFVLVAFAPMVRFQGLFLCLAFAASLLARVISKGQRSTLSMAMAIAGGLATVFPFALWTWRNIQQFTPETFNMANNVFWGLKGLALRAPGYGRVDWIDAEWKYGIYHLVISVKKVGMSVFGENVISLIPIEFVFIFLVVLVFAGSLHWFKKATQMEQIYVVLSLSFLVWESLRKHSLYVVVRYWLPVLPFLLISAGLGLRIVYKKLKKTRYHVLSGVLIGFLFVLVLSNGVSYFFKHVSLRTSNYYRNANQVVAKVKQFMDEKAKPGVPVATTDWGVMPFALKRTCYQVLHDKSHLLTLKRMNKYQTGYLVILDKLTSRPPVTRKMVEDLPQLFTLMLEVQPDGTGPAAAIYSVDLEGVQAFLKDASMKKSES